MKKRHPIRSSDIRKIIEELKPKFGEEIKTLLDGKVEKAKLESGKDILLVDEEPVLVKEDDQYFPTISAADRLALKRVTIDMGAVKPVSNGADIMAPGIVQVDENIKKGDMVGIEDEKNNKLIALGTALENGPSLEGEEGKVIKNIHYVGDKFWELQEAF